MRTPVLFLTHRIPYPPDKGDKIRSYNILLELNKHYDVHLGCFIDNPKDWQYLDTLSTLCSSLQCLPLPRFKRYLKSIVAFLTGRPITLPLYHSARLHRWVKQTIDQHCIKRVVVFSGAMAQYVESPSSPLTTRVVDFVDVDSDKWAQYASKKRGIARYVYQREHRLLQTYEHRIAQSFDASLFVSEQEASLFRSTLPATAVATVGYVNNGVDSDYFDPNQVSAAPPISNAPFIVFTGAMDYWANGDAVSWFCSHVWPQLSRSHPGLEFIIVGSDPSPAVKQLAQIDGVRVTGRVDDVRPYIHQASLVVAPLQIARGIQNKVLEAMAMEKPVIATRMAIEGIDTHSGLAVLIADTPELFFRACHDALKLPTPEANKANRLWIQHQFSWQQTLSKIAPLLNDPNKAED